MFIPKCHYYNVLEVGTTNECYGQSPFCHFLPLIKVIIEGEV